MLKTKINFSGDFEEFSAKLQSSFTEAALTAGDGVRFDIGKSWVHIRSSNTEPIVRIIAEAATVLEAQALIDKARAVLSE